MDWLRLPRTDSTVCFAALLGSEEHGRWLICPSEPVRRVSRLRREDTLILETDLDTDNGAVRLIDFMPFAQWRRAPGRFLALAGPKPLHLSATVELDPDDVSITAKFHVRSGFGSKRCGKRCVASVTRM